MRLDAELGARSWIAEALAEVGRAVTQSPNPMVVRQRIADILRALLGVRSVVVLRLEVDSGALVSAAGSDGADAGLPATCPPERL